MLQIIGAIKLLPIKKDKGQERKVKGSWTETHTIHLVTYIYLFIYVSKCSTSIQIPHIQTILTKHIEVAPLGHKIWQFINCFLQNYMMLIFLFTLVNLTNNNNKNTLLEAL